MSSLRREGVNPLRRGWESLWFEPIHAARLALVRIAVGAYSLWLLWNKQRSYVRMAGTDESLFRPVGPAWLLHSEDGLPALLQGWGLDSLAESLTGAIHLDTFAAFYNAAIILNILFLVGFRFRVTGPLFAVLLLWVLSYRNSWTMIYHSANLLVFHVLILGITPSANALSVDALLRKRCRRWPWLLGSWKLADSPVDWRYGWPIRLIIGVTTVTYCLAGIAKVAGPLGWSWASGDSLMTYIFRDGIRKELMGSGATEATFWAHEATWLLTILAVMTLVLELAAPLVLVGPRGSRFRRWAPPLWALAAWGMHWGILFIMGIEFLYQRCGVAFAAFLPLERLLGFKPTARD